jgi:hypothetical protein
MEPVARAMTTITHELDRLHSQGYTLRQRAGGGMRGAWHADLRHAGRGRALVSWDAEPRKPNRLDQLARLLATVHPSSALREADTKPPLVRHMRDISDEAQRDRAVDRFIADHPDMPIEDLLEALERQHFLDPQPDGAPPDVT